MATTTFPTRDDFAALLNESLGGENEAFEGKVVKGTITAIENDMIKIDRSFVTNIQGNKESLAITRAVTTLANALSVPVCVEGIESEGALEAVVALGCEVGQGWYFGKPMPAEQARDLLNLRTHVEDKPRANVANG